MLDAVEDLVDQTAGPPELSPVGPDSAAATTGFLRHFSRTAMACEFTIYVNLDDAHAPLRAIEALDLVDRLEDQMSVYRAHSEICRINRLAATEMVPVESRLLELLDKAMELYRSTQGAFDITSGPLSRVWGFHRRQGRVPNESERSAALRCVGSDAVQIDRDAGTIHFQRPDIELNLGGIGKGYALDRAAEHLMASGVDHFLIHGGKSSVLGHGAMEAATTAAWTIELRHPLRPDRLVGSVRLVDRAVGTSGSRFQSFHHQGRRLGHILDPRTGWPAAQVVSATVVHPSAAIADALATACYVLGVDATAKFCEHHPQAGVILIRDGDQVGEIVVDVFNLTDEEVTIHS